MPRNALRRTLVVLALPALLGAGTDPHRVSMAEGFPVTKRSEVFPVSAVQRGQRGVGFTVFEGDRVESFSVEVLGVLEGMLGPGEDVVLARLGGERIEFTGVIAGMSGSPVFIDGKLLGAVAYRFGQFAKEPIAGITPIERMLPVLNAPPSRPTSPPLPLGVLGRAPPDGVEPAIGFGPAPAGPLGRIATPVAVSGLHPAARARLDRQLGGFGLTAEAGRGPKRGDNGSGRAGTVPSAPIRPGAPIAALLARGDINLTAIGTVTYVEDGRVLGFGHPFVGHGTVAFPLATAAILNTLASDAGSYKQGLASLEVGVVSEDRLTAIGGRLGGPPAPMIPLSVEVRDGDAVQRTQVEIVDSPAWLPTLTDTVVSNAVLQRLEAEVGGTVHMRLGVEVGDRFLEIEDSYAATAPTQVAAFAARDAARVLAIVARNPLAPASIRRVQIRMTIERDVHSFELLDARAAPLEVSPGGSVELVARLRPYRGAITERRLTIAVPPDAPLGPLELFVGGGLELDQRDVASRGKLDPTELDGLLGVLASRRPGDSLFARLYIPQPGLRIGAEVYPSLPASVRASISSHSALGAEPIDERPGPSARIGLDGVVYGQTEINLTVIPVRGQSR